MAASDHTPGRFPEVHDEAGDTPSWVPILGLGLLGLFALVAVYRVATASDEPTEVEVVAAQPAEEGAAGEEAAAPAPAAPTPAAAPAAPGGGADSFGRRPGDEHFGHDHP